MHINDSMIWDDDEAEHSRDPRTVLWHVPQPKIYIAESDISGEGTHLKVPAKQGEALFLAFIVMNGSMYRTVGTRYINHSTLPTSELVEALPFFYFRALRDVALGEEVTVDYRTIPWYKHRVIE